MLIKTLNGIVAFILWVLVLTGCTVDNPFQDEPAADAVAVLYPTNDSAVQGNVIFVKQKQGLRIYARLEGLTPGLHGFHIHEFGDCRASDAASAGGHFNPTQQIHGGPAQPERHSGDLGNIEADASGKGHLELASDILSLQGRDSIIGRSVIVHERPDDLKTQPAGAAGARLACGVIGWAAQ
jgi:Cu-Zn family superoxide dismutase